ncbi:MAG: helix-hairpin-helix domain-containing protein [Saprospiraceae bacterium]
MKQVIRTFFFFSKRERIGVLCLLTLLLVCFLIPRVYSFYKSESPVDFAEFDQAIALLEKRQAEKSNSSAGAKKTDNAFTNKNQKKNYQAIQLFLFDPNTLSKDSFELLGLSPKLANTIINYRNKGGKFFNPEGFKKMYGLSTKQYEQLRSYIHITAFGKPKPVYASNLVKSEKRDIQLQFFDPNTATTEELLQLGISKKVSSTLIKFRSKGGRFYKKEDLKKVYGLSDIQYQELEPYINIAEDNVAYNSSNDETVTSYNNSDQRIENPIVNIKKSVTIDINKATPEEWQQLRGIGPTYAKRITKFRDKLGGFVNINQVAETYGLHDSTFQKIQPFLETSDLLQKIALNESDVKTLAAHPYISYQIAKVIVAYRQQHGAFKRVEDLKEIVVLEEEVFLKIAPYLEVK